MSLPPYTTADALEPPEHLKATLDSIRRNLKPPDVSPPLPTAGESQAGAGSPGLPVPRRGLRTPTHTQVPNEVLDQLLPVLSGPELKCLLLIIRRTFGWHQPADAISLSQMQGTLSLSRSTTVRALDSLEERGFIERHRQPPGPDRRAYEATVFALRLTEEGG